MVNVDFCSFILCRARSVFHYLVHPFAHPDMLPLLIDWWTQHTYSAHHDPATTNQHVSAEDGNAPPQRSTSTCSMQSATSQQTWLDLPNLLQVLSVKDADDRTALDLAVLEGNWPAVRCLMSAGVLQVGAHAFRALRYAPWSPGTYNELAHPMFHRDTFWCAAHKYNVLFLLCTECALNIIICSLAQDRSQVCFLRQHV